MRPKRSVVIFDPWRNNHLNFFELDHKDLEIKETEYTGKGVFAKRTFRKNEFVVNYRGILTDNHTSEVFAFDLGRPDHFISDAEKTADSLCRYMNDVDPFHNTNCFPVKFSHDNVVLKQSSPRKFSNVERNSVTITGEVPLEEVEICRKEEVVGVWRGDRI